MNCPNCGKSITARQKFCAGCGQTLRKKIDLKTISLGIRNKKNLLIVGLSLLTIISLTAIAIIANQKIPNGRLAQLLLPIKASDLEDSPAISTTPSPALNPNDGSILTKTITYNIDGSVLSSTESYTQNHVETALQTFVNIASIINPIYGIQPAQDLQEGFVPHKLIVYHNTLTQINFGPLARPLSYMRYDNRGRLLAEIYYTSTVELDQEKSFEYGYSGDSTEPDTTSKIDALTIPVNALCKGGFLTPGTGGDGYFDSTFLMDSFYAGYFPQDNSNQRSVIAYPDELITGEQPLVDSKIKEILLDSGYTSAQDMKIDVKRFDEFVNDEFAYTILVINSDEGSRKEIYEIAFDGQLIRNLDLINEYVTRYNKFTYDQNRRLKRLDFFIADYGGIFDGCYYENDKKFRMPYYIFDYDSVGHMTRQTAHFATGNLINSYCWSQKYDRNGRIVQYTDYDVDRTITFGWVYKENRLQSETQIGSYDSGDVSHKRVYQYDSNDNVSVVIEYASETKDFKNQMLSCIYSQSGDDDGTTIVKRSEYDEWGNLSKEKELYYNPRGYLISIINKYSDSWSSYYAHVVLEYNENMDVIRITGYDFFGQKETAIEFVY